MIDLWDQWPGRRLPPMPNQLKTNVNSSTVDATLAYFPGVDELPLPMPAAPEVSAPAASSVGTGLRRPVGAASHDQPAGEDDDLYPPLVLADVDMWSRWPGVEALPMPMQVLPVRPADVTQSVAAADTIVPVLPDNGAMPMQLDLAAFLSALTIALRLTTRHGRAMLAVLGSWFDQRRRAQVLLRLASGMLRLW